MFNLNIRINVKSIVEGLPNVIGRELNGKKNTSSYKKSFILWSGLLITEQLLLILVLLPQFLVLNYFSRINISENNLRLLYIPILILMVISMTVCLNISSGYILNKQWDIPLKRWIGRSILGGIIGSIVLPIGFVLSSIITTGRILLVFSGLVFGAVIGIFQNKVLKDHIPFPNKRYKLWPIFSAFIFSVPFLVGIMLGILYAVPQDSAIFLLIIILLIVLFLVIGPISAAGIIWFIPRRIDRTESKTHN